MNKSESRYFNTARKMDEAFLELLEKKDLEYLTVKEICNRAGVNRSTFYLHYETMADLLTESVEMMNDQFLQYFQEQSRCIVQNIHTAPIEDLFLLTPEYLSPYLSYIAEHRKLFQTSIAKATDLRMENSFELLCTHVFFPILDRYGVPEEEKSYIIAFYIHGLLGIIDLWLAQDCREPKERITGLMMRLVGNARP